MKFILGEKINMTQVFDADGTVHPVTLVKTGDIVVTQIKDKDKDGYKAVQVGYGKRSAKRMKKPQLGHLKKSEGGRGAGSSNFKYLKEFPIGDNTYNVSDVIDLSSFAAGDKVVITAITKGKGFQGVVKRHGFKGGPRSHGQKHSEREPGSISQGLRTGPHKGLRMAGRMGGDRVTEKNHKIIDIDSALGLIMISGAIPGRRGTLVEIKK